MKNSLYIFSHTPPSSLASYTQVAGCFCNINGKFLLLKRHEEKPQGGTWCLPAGKMEPGETPQEAAIREVKEEIGLEISPLDLLKVGTFTIEHSHGKIVFHTFSHRLKGPTELVIDTKESIDFRWVTFDDLDEMNLIIAGKEVLTVCKEHLF